MVFGASTRVRGKVFLDAIPHVIERLRSKEINGVKKLAILQQVSMTVPETGNRIAIRHSNVDSSYSMQRVSVFPGPDMTKQAIFHREALRRWVFGIMSPHTPIAINGKRAMLGGGEEERVLLERIGKDGGSDSRDEDAPAKER
ncbi:hypothetical protein MKX07_000682 [Trichoderma sp. CBMAI-0711]|nr:hypothetical protein MKX07_000682 [Trichoderma sp. CBMAI-0711]